ncbi:MAG: DUF1684 domain-containing protein [Sphingobacteriales bacterium]|nr:MAG: DUF1684 domain-containing protein [Sphingobacteriales bacterium]
MKITLAIAALIISSATHAQTYSDSILEHRKHYKQEFITEERSPLKGNDTSFLSFYTPDAKYRVMAKLKKTPEAQPFQMPTRSGKTKTYRQYGTLEFSINDTPQVLQVFQSIDLMKKDKKYEKHLFLPFTDATSSFGTYGGGRYIDLSTDDITNNRTIVIDFNKCYNPYCAYATGYNCPIPPAENRLQIAITAGELMYGKVHEE